MAYHGGARPGEEGLIDFSQSANPYYPAFLNSYLRRARYSAYPYCEQVYEPAIKEKYGVKGDAIITAGVTEGLYAASYALRGRRAVILSHTYSEYERAWRLLNPGSEVVKVEPLDPTMDDIMSNVKRGDVVFFGNPNNPTGRYYEWVPKMLEELEELGAYLILDEAFVAFTGRPYFNPESDNAVVLRSFTKEYGIPGIRIGYAAAFGEVAKRIRDYRAPWAIGAAGCAALEGILNEKGFLRESLKRIWRERDRIERATGLKTDANFFLMDVGDAKKVSAYLRDRGILVRDCTSFGLPRMIRFSVRKRRENSLLLKLILEVER